MPFGVAFFIYILRIEELMNEKKKTVDQRRSGPTKNTRFLKDYALYKQQ